MMRISREDDETTERGGELGEERYTSGVGSSLAGLRLQCTPFNESKLSASWQPKNHQAESE